MQKGSYILCMKASELISKKVYAIYEGNEIGYILNFSLNEKMDKLDFLELASLFEENEFIFKAEDISAITEDAVFIKSEKSLMFETNAKINNPIGKKIFSLDGKFLGKVKDVEFDKFAVKKIIGSDCEILTKYIYSYGNDCLFFSKNKIKKERPIEKICSVEVKAQVLLPKKEKSQGIDYIGKTIWKDILDENHIIIFRKNTVVTPKIVLEAKRLSLLKRLGEVIK